MAFVRVIDPVEASRNIVFELPPMTKPPTKLDKEKKVPEWIFDYINESDSSSIEFMPILAVEYSGTHLKIIRPEVFYMSQSRTGLWWRLIRLSWPPGILTSSMPRPRRRTPCKRVTSITPTKDKMAFRVCYSDMFKSCLSATIQSQGDYVTG